MNLAPSFGVTAADHPRPEMEDAFCPHCGRPALPPREGAWGKVKSVLWEAEFSMSLSEIAKAAGVSRNDAAVALNQHLRELRRTGKARAYLYRLRWRA